MTLLSGFFVGKYRRPTLALLAFIAIFVLATIGYSLFSLKYSVVQVRGESMYPTFTPGDRIVLDKTNKGEVDQFVLFKLPNGWKDRWLGDDDTTLIKRVALVPGDVLSWDGLNWYRNGEQFSSISEGTCDIEPMTYTMGPGEYFVTGDTSTTQTMDSREAFCFNLGFPVKEEQVEVFGRVVKTF